jgi:hypothetical protein
MPELRRPGESMEDSRGSTYSGKARQQSKGLTMSLGLQWGKGTDGALMSYPQGRAAWMSPPPPSGLRLRQMPSVPLPPHLGLGFAPSSVVSLGWKTSPRPEVLQREQVSCRGKWSISRLSLDYPRWVIRILSLNYPRCQHILGGGFHPQQQ